MKTSKERLNIAMLTPWDQRCGNAEYAKRLAMILQEDFSIRAYDMENYMDSWKENGNKITPRSIDRALAQIAKSVNSSNCDVVHIQHEFCFFGARSEMSMLRLLRLITRLKAPVAITLHTWAPRHSSWNYRSKMIFKKPHLYVAFRIVKFLMRLCLSKVDAIVVHSHITYNLVVAAFPALKAKLYVIPIPIEPVAPSSQPLREKADGDKWIILPGFVTPYKGHIVAIQALQYLPNNYKLVIAGGVHPKNKKAANYWSELLSCIDSLSMMSRVYITGFIESANDQANLFGLADAFLLPYEEVGQSGSAVLADALAQDKPVITSLAQSMFVYRMNPETADSSIAVSMKRPRKIASLIKSAVEEDDIRRSSRISALERVYSLYGASASRKAYHQMFDKITR